MLSEDQKRDEQTRAEVRENARKTFKYALLPSVAVFVLMLLLIQAGVDFGLWLLFSFLAVVGSATVVGFTEYAWRFARFNPIDRERLAGASVVSLPDSQPSDGVPVGNARMPARAEPLHTLIEGATGTGKTQLLKQMVAYIRARGDTLVVVDTGYDLHKTFGQPGDIVLSIFDEASPGWLPQNEVRIPADWNALAQSLIGNGQGEARQWHDMAKAMFAAVARGYQRMVDDAGDTFDHAEFFDLLTAADVDEIAPFLRGSSVAALADNDRALSNVRMTFFNALAFWQDLKPGNFSARKWVEQGGQRPSIFIPHSKRTLPASKNAISCWIDQIITEASDGGESSQQVWIIIDELSSLGTIPSLETAVTELRKTGFRVICGIQNFEQIEDRYGKSTAITITNNLSNKVIFRATNGDAAERQSRLIGDARHRITTYSTSSSTGGQDGKKSKSTTVNTADAVERVVLPSEIMGLPDLRAYVKWSGEEETFLTNIPIYRG